MSFSLASRSAPKYLVAPMKIAQSLDWQKRSGAILSVHVGQKSIDLAATSHPGHNKEPVQTLPSIPIQLETKENSKVLKQEVLQEISEIAKDWKVCGMVVSWPVQREGWIGAPCGKVMHYLDQIVDTNIKVCLWNGHHWASGEDEWGRTAIYSRPSSKTTHIASREQYKEDGMVATDIAKDFLAFHWPDLLDRSKHGSHQEMDSLPIGTHSGRTTIQATGKSLIWERC